MLFYMIVRFHHESVLELDLIELIQIGAPYGWFKQGFQVVKQRVRSSDKYGSKVKVNSKRRGGWG